MTDYNDQLTTLSRKPCTFVVMTLDYCANTFGSAPCTAFGTKCYNTYGTCKDRLNYVKTTKDYQFSSADAPLPFPGPRPYITEIKYMPTEIQNNKTVIARTKLAMVDEPDSDVGIDPYLSTRTSVQGTFWKKLLARNPNYKGRPLKIYDGFIGLSSSDYILKNNYVLDNITWDSNDAVIIETTDILKPLSKINIPTKIDAKLRSALGTAGTIIYLTSLEGLDLSGGYVKIDDEIIQYTGTSVPTNRLTGGVRGCFDTTPATHTNKTQVSRVEYFAPGSGYDHLQTILTLAGIDAGDIDTAAFTAAQTFPIADTAISRWAVMTEPAPADELYFNLVDELDCKSWVDENQKITIVKNIQNYPGRVYKKITDSENIVDNATAVDLNEESRISRITVYWDKSLFGGTDDRAEYSRIDISIDADSEGVNEFNEIKDKVIYSIWLHYDSATEEVLNLYLRNHFRRQLMRMRDASPLYDFEVELKDRDSIVTGLYIKATTPDIQDAAGNPVTEKSFQIVKKELKDNNKSVKLRAVTMPDRKIGFIAPNDSPDYGTATDADKEYAFIAQNNGLMSDDKKAYRIY